MSNPRPVKVQTLARIIYSDGVCAVVKTELATPNHDGFSPESQDTVNVEKEVATGCARLRGLIGSVGVTELHESATQSRFDKQSQVAQEAAAVEERLRQQREGQ